MRAGVEFEPAQSVSSTAASILAEREPERLDRALEPLEQVDRHELLEPCSRPRCPRLDRAVPPL